MEWEKAARGADRRHWPWGDFGDPTWACVHGARDGRPMPSLTDDFATDVSPYGVRGMARIAAEALKLDKRNKLHLKNSAVRAIILAGVAGDDVLAVARKDKKNKDGLYELLAADAVMKASDIEQSKAAIKVIEAVDKLGFQDTDIASFVLTNAAIWADELLKDSAKAKTMAKKALAVGVSGAERARLNKILDR